jgi:hypothetical protein
MLSTGTVTTQDGNVTHFMTLSFGCHHADADVPSLPASPSKLIIKFSPLAWQNNHPHATLTFINGCRRTAPDRPEFYYWPLPGERYFEWFSSTFQNYPHCLQPEPGETPSTRAIRLKHNYGLLASKIQGLALDWQVVGTGQGIENEYKAGRFAFCFQLSLILLR